MNNNTKILILTTALSLGLYFLIHWVLTYDLIFNLAERYISPDHHIEEDGARWVNKVHQLLLLAPFLTCLIGTYVSFLLSKTRGRNREPFVVYFFLSVITLYIRHKLIIPHYPVIEKVIEGTALAPNQYRIIVPYIILGFEGILKVDLVTAKLCVEFIFIISSFCLFHIYLSRWFDIKTSMIGTLYLIAAIPLSFWLDYPSAFSELLIFTVGYMLIRDCRDNWLLGLVPIASLHRETCIFLVVSYLLSRYRKRPLSKVLTNTTIYSLLWFIPFIVVRLVYGLRPYRCEFFMVKFNIEHMLDYKNYFLFLLLGPFFFFGLKNLKRVDPFLKRNIATVGLFILTAFLCARIYEVRIFYPVIPILIPLGLYSFDEIKS